MVFTIISFLIRMCDFTLIAATFLLISPAAPVSAQSTPPPNDENCKSCHENRYLLYDSGKWYCLCSLQAHCTFCHNGNREVKTAVEAHIGMIANPVKDNSEACQRCHPQDASTRIEKFAVLAGIESISTPIPMQTQSAPLTLSSDEQITSPLLNPEPLTIWKTAALISILLAACVLLVFVYRLPKENHSV